MIRDFLSKQKEPSALDENSAGGVGVGVGHYLSFSNNPLTTEGAIDHINQIDVNSYGKHPFLEHHQTF